MHILKEISSQTHIGHVRKIYILGHNNSRIGFFKDIGNILYFVNIYNLHNYIYTLYSIHVHVYRLHVHLDKHHSGPHKCVICNGYTVNSLDSEINETIIVTALLEV